MAKGFCAVPIEIVQESYTLAENIQYTSGEKKSFNQTVTKAGYYPISFFVKTDYSARLHVGVGILTSINNGRVTFYIETKSLEVINADADIILVVNWIKL